MTAQPVSFGRIDAMLDFLTAAKDPTTAFSIGSLEVKWYALFIVTAMIIGLAYVCVECKKIKLNADDAVELFLWIIPLAIVFARLLYIIPGRVDEYFPWNSWDDFVHFIAIWEGGLTIIGGLVGGVLGGIFFTIRHRKQCNFGNVADLVVVPLLTGQIIGRLGNFVNQEAFGKPILDERFQFFPFGVYIDRPSGVSDKFRPIVDANTPGWFCATFFYEMVWNTIGLVFCLIFWKKGKNQKYPGFMLIFYLFWYMLGRLWLEFLRMDAVPVTKVLCGIVAPIALIVGVLYILACDSKEAYKRVRAIAERGLQANDALTDYDIKNYNFVGKVLANKKNPLRLIYAKGEYITLHFDEAEFYRVPKGYRRRFKDITKVESYIRQV